MRVETLRKGISVWPGGLEGVATQPKTLTKRPQGMGTFLSCNCLDDLKVCLEAAKAPRQAERRHPAFA